MAKEFCLAFFESVFPFFLLFLDSLNTTFSYIYICLSVCLYVYVSCVYLPLIQAFISVFLHFRRLFRSIFPPARSNSIILNCAPPYNERDASSCVKTRCKWLIGCRNCAFVLPAVDFRLLALHPPSLQSSLSPSPSFPASIPSLPPPPPSRAVGAKPHAGESLNLLVLTGLFSRG